MSVRLLSEHHLEFLSLKGGCTGSSESTLVKVPHCLKSHVTAQINVQYCFAYHQMLSHQMLSGFKVVFTVFKTASLYFFIILFCFVLTLNLPIATKDVCFSHLLKCLRRLYGKQCGPRSDCSYWSSLF